MLAIIGAFFICGIGGAFIASFLNVWDIPVAGFLAAFSVVAVAYLSAPINPKVFINRLIVVRT